MVNTLTAADLSDLLDKPAEFEEQLRALGVADLRRAHENLVRIAEAGVPLDLLSGIYQCLLRERPNISDPDMALNNLERFILAARSPLSLAALFERDREALPVILQMLSSSQHLSELLTQEPEIYDLLRMTEGQPFSRDILIEELCTEVQPIAADQARVMDLLRFFKRRETARIIYGDVVRTQRLETVTRQISHVADAICEAALLAATLQLATRYGSPTAADGTVSQFVVLSLGKLGGCELNYSSDIDLIFVYASEGQTDGERTISNAEYFDNLARRFVKMLSHATERGLCYRVDLRLRPEGHDGPIVISRSAAMRYYDVKGRTWERQAFVKARPVAGNLELGQQILADLAPWVYRRYLSQADITGIKALKRKIEKRALTAGKNRFDVKSGHGGIRDIEFTIQFLQLLNGGDLPEVRTGNTLAAIAALESVGCLTMQERSILEENYTFLRKIEHRLQIMFDMQTHELPHSGEELNKLAIRLGYIDQRGDRGLTRFQREFDECTSRNRKILDHLLHDAFPEAGDVTPEVDLVLDPEIAEDTVHEVLTKYGFRDVAGAFRNLTALANEQIPFLSTRRCRHFLAAIAGRLLTAIAHTPDPDATLLNLSRVSDSLGGKGALWELFSANEASLQLYVRLCAGSPYLSSVLTTNPGMIDELMDSLVLKHLPHAEQVSKYLADLCDGAEDLQPILHSFKNSMHLQVGVRDVLGKEDIRTTTETLSDTAQVCLQQVALREYERLVKKFGVPRLASEVRDAEDNQNGKPRSIGLPLTSDSCELVILGMGKLGGREPNYHSDLDVIFLYEHDGQTRHNGRPRTNNGRDEETTTNQHFFTELGQNIIRTITRIGPLGRLFEMDPRLRPTGKSGALAVSFDEFARYFDDADGHLWERQALCKARPIFGSAAARERVMKLVQHILRHPAWQDSFVEEIAATRKQMEATASCNNLKRGPGGTVDIEFIVQMLQLKHAAQAAVLVPGTLAAISALRESNILNAEDADYLCEAYRFLRRVESRLRLLNTTARHDLPDSDAELSRLAYLLGDMDSPELQARCEKYRAQNRECFQRLLGIDRP